MKLSDLGEKRLVDYILSRIGSPDLLLGVGDDAIAFKAEGITVMSVDMLVASTDVPPAMSMKQVGLKAITMTASDLASKGAEPRYFLLSVALPPSMTYGDFKSLWSGFEQASTLYGGRIIAGDTNQANDIIVDSIGVGSAKNLVSRKGAQPGDIVAVTGYFGRTAAGLKILLEGLSDSSKEYLTQPVLNPRARIQEGIALAGSGAVTSSIDSSDGLAMSLHELSRASNVGFRITDPPVDERVGDFAERKGLPLLDLVFYGGEEYELLVTVNPEDWKRAERAIEEADGKLLAIGRVTSPDPGVVTEWRGKLVSLQRRGWIHFRSS